MVMGVHRRASAGVAAAVAAVTLIAVGPGVSLAASTPAAGVRSSSRAKLVTFVRPTGDTLVQAGTGPIRVIVHLRAGARLTKVDVDGVDVTRLLRPGPNGDYRALLRFGPHLHYGYNDAFAKARGPGGTAATGHVRFIVAQRDDSLLALTSFRTDTAAAPLQVGVRETTGTHVRAAIHRGSRCPLTRVYQWSARRSRVLAAGRAGAGAIGRGRRPRFGRNLVQVLVDKTHPYKRQSSYDIESRTVIIARNAPIASAGADLTITGGDFVQLNGRATKLPPGWTRPSFRWTIVSAPKGSKARLGDASGSRPTLVPNRPGVYDVRVSVRAKPPGAGGGPAFTAAAASPPGVSNDTATLTVMPDIPPVGLRLDTVSGSDRGILLDGKPLSRTGLNPTFPATIQLCAGRSPDARGQGQWIYRRHARRHPGPRQGPRRLHRVVGLSRGAQLELLR